jgi:hypothetical protein
LAQRLAQLLYTQLVGGSNPSPPTIPSFVLVLLLILFLASVFLKKEDGEENEQGVPTPPPR